MTALPPLNPPAVNTFPANYYSPTVFNFGVPSAAGLAPGQSQIAYVPVMVDFHPLTLILTNPGQTLVQVTVNGYLDIVGGTSPPLQWGTLTSEGLMSILSVITAMQITNTGGSGTIYAVLGC